VDATGYRIGDRQNASWLRRPFGAVIVRDQQVIGWGWNQVTSTNDPTAHAEIVAIRDACEKQKSFSLTGSTIYCSCQPCPMCHGAILWSRINKIFFAATTEQAANAGFDDRRFREELIAEQQDRHVQLLRILEKEAAKPFESWQQDPHRVQY
jgi:guanine deaminase